MDQILSSFWVDIGGLSDLDEFVSLYRSIILLMHDIALFNYLPIFECDQKCKYYSISKSDSKERWESYTTCPDICCSTAYPTSISSACCKKSPYEWWWIA
ncbi:unnamed protein product [Brachionus calyciflorus]|uniref:Uncharacterized protein n=1 Tax=Brachionus calyciflorus TaxID=104777 RepID=A0A814R1E0_9BILA|nr:unnamed protein product [Brachionus calyciflorus]